MNLKMVFDWIKNGCELFSIYVLWILLFYTASHLHTYLCTPSGFYGLLITPFMVQTPHCCAFRWILKNGDIHILAFWSIIAGMIVRKIDILRG